MKFLVLLFSLFLNLNFAMAKTAPATVWGKILKTDKPRYGYQYFVYFKKDGQDYAYPISSETKLAEKQLRKLQGKYAKIYGSEKFEKVNLEGTSHILTFKISQIKELKLSELRIDLSYDIDQNNPILLQNKERKSDVYLKEGLSDKAVNTAIFTGGAIIAAEVLRSFLTN